MKRQPRTSHRATHGVAPIDPPYVSAPAPGPGEVAAYQQMARDWLVMWSPWRRVWTAMALFGSEPIIIDHPNPWELLKHCHAAEMAAAARSNLAIPV